jgi:sec-independent protein translocase protein TatA
MVPTSTPLDAAALSDVLVPAFPGIPGGPELLIILLIMLVVFGLPFVLLVGAVFLGWNVLGSRRGRVEELEERVAELERELERERTGSHDPAGSESREERD